MPLRAGISADEKPAGLGLSLYRDPPSFVFEAEMEIVLSRHCDEHSLSPSAAARGTGRRSLASDGERQSGLPRRRPQIDAPDSQRSRGDDDRSQTALRG
jgi:hypothetical protein